jgi:hypothetical protein
MTKEYVEGLIDEGVRALELAIAIHSHPLSVKDSIEAHVNVAKGYAELAKVAALLIGK